MVSSTESKPWNNHFSFHCVRTIIFILNIILSHSPELGEVVSNTRRPNNSTYVLKSAFARIGYWRNLGSSRDFTNHTLKSCVNVIHEDIISVWNFDDRDSVGHSFMSSVLYAEGNQYLLSGEFRSMMTNLVGDMTGMPDVSWVYTNTRTRERTLKTDLRTALTYI